MRDGFTPETEEVSVSIPESVKVYNGDILFSWSASLEVIQWAFGEGGLNQHIFKVTGKEGFPKGFYYFQILNYVEVFRKIAEARKTTMGHITQDHLKQSRIAIPSEKSILERFDDYLKPVMDNQVKLIEEISSLKDTRDFLLPLLLNGQVSIA
jgi:type I restriction enzyme S subunit